MTRTAIAMWKGGPGAGEGSVSTSSGVFSNVLYSFSSGMGNEPCTSPAEMLAAAVASCMSLMVTQEMARAGIRQEYVKTESILTLEEQKHRWHISGIHLNITSHVPQVDVKKFEQACRNAKAKCPISHALKIPIKLTMQLEESHAAAA